MSFCFPQNIPNIKATFQQKVGRWFHFCTCNFFHGKKFCSSDFVQSGINGLLWNWIPPLLYFLSLLFNIMGFLCSNYKRNAPSLFQLKDYCHVQAMDTLAAKNYRTYSEDSNHFLVREVGNIQDKMKKLISSMNSGTKVVGSNCESAPEITSLIKSFTIWREWETLT